MASSARVQGRIEADISRQETASSAKDREAVNPAVACKQTGGSKDAPSSICLTTVERIATSCLTAAIRRCHRLDRRQEAGG